MTVATFFERPLRLMRAASVLFVGVAVSACPSDGPVDPPPTDNTVASVAVSAPGTSVQAGATLQLSAQAKNAAGSTLAGKTFTWSSSSAAIAEVSTTGLVTGQGAGSATITATESGSGKSGTLSLTVTAAPEPVATVTVSPASATVTQGGTQQLSVTLKDQNGVMLTGRSVAWTSSDATIASVNASGLVSAAAAGGPVTITATSEGRTGSSAITVVARSAASVAVTPAFTAVAVDGTAALEAAAFDASNVAIPDPEVTWASGSSGIATVSTSGSVQGVAPGQSAITAQVGSATDTAWVAVLASNSLLSTSFAGGDAKASLTPGQTITVPVLLDLSRVSANGDLGSIQFDLLYDSNLLTYVSAEAGVTGSANFNAPTAGTFKFSFAGTDPQGGSQLTLVTVTFEVATSAPVGAQRAFTLTYTAQPTNTSFVAYSTPVSVGGRIRIVAP